ncbi:hypothetical protein H920_07686 [Fukomys damarensis]|uniref:Uncharacterized protein n=1 Tax=Fukomys damarensis TaxID=885580 RepID=A0A091DKY2_FUKDA|nr:hypothetical protein H920_07686 [Fukomys damarensis]
MEMSHTVCELRKLPDLAAEGKRDSCRDNSCARHKAAAPQEHTGNHSGRQKKPKSHEAPDSASDQIFSEPMTMSCRDSTKRLGVIHKEQELCESDMRPNTNDSSDSIRSHKLINTGLRALPTALLGMLFS